MAYRKAKGLCYRCGMKWGPSHKSFPLVSIHLVEELWQLVHGEEPPSENSPVDEADSGDDLMVL